MRIQPGLIALLATSLLGCGDTSTTNAPSVNPYDQRAPLAPAGPAASPRPVSRGQAATTPGASPRPSGSPQRTMKTQVIEIAPHEEPTGPPLPLDEYIVWTRRVTAQLNEMARLYEAIAADGDVQGRVSQWSDACFELEKAYGEAIRTPRPSPEICRQLAQTYLPELQTSIERAEAAEAAADALEGEIHIFIGYGKKLAERFSIEGQTAPTGP